MLKDLEKQDTTPVYKNSKKNMTPGHDKASVLVSGEICPCLRKKMEEIYLRLLEDHPDNAELKVVLTMTKNQHEWNFIAPYLLERFNCADCI